MTSDSMWRQAIRVMWVPRHEEIAAVAYAKYLQRQQRPSADATRDWLEAEADLRQTTARLNASHTAW
jgi:hypothetical protein